MRATRGADWNVVALSDLGGRVVERYAYDPYGRVTVHQETGEPRILEMPIKQDM